MSEVLTIQPIGVTPGTERPCEESHPSFESNFMHRIHTLVYKILEQMRTHNTNSKKQIDELERKYERDSKLAADMQRKIGKAAPWFAAASFALALGAMKFPEPEYAQLRELIAQGAPRAIQELVTSKWSANQQELQSLANLWSTKLSQKNTDRQSESGREQEFKALLQTAIEAMKRASSN